MKKNSKERIDLDTHVLPWLGRTMKAMDFFIADQFAKEGVQLTKAQFILLKVLSRKDGIAQNNLAFITNRDKTSLTRLIHTMERKEFVLRESSSKDKRVNLVYLTSKGKKTLEDASPSLKKINAQIQNGLSQKEIDSTIKTLKQIGKNINADFLTAPLTQSNK